MSNDAQAVANPETKAEPRLTSVLPVPTSLNSKTQRVKNFLKRNCKDIDYELYFTDGDSYYDGDGNNEDDGRHRRELYFARNLRYITGQVVRQRQALSVLGISAHELESRTKRLFGFEWISFAKEEHERVEKKKKRRPIKSDDDVVKRLAEAEHDDDEIPFITSPAPDLCRLFTGDDADPSVLWSPVA